MFFDEISDIKNLAGNAHFAIFVLPEKLISGNLERLRVAQAEANAKKPARKTVKTAKTGAKFAESPENLAVLPDFAPNAFHITPDARKNKIYIDQVREITEKLTVRQGADLFVVFWQAEKLSPEAENAFLKNLEEPAEHYHFVFYTSDPSALLPTVRSRAQVFYLTLAPDLTAPPEADARELELAKKLITARPGDLPALAEIFHKKPADRRRQFALGVVALAIELLQKSYHKTGNRQFLDKLPKFLQLHENLTAGGHVKLHVVADLL